MSDTQNGYIMRTRRAYEQALNDLNYLHGLTNGIICNIVSFDEFNVISAKFKNITTILDECIMNCEFNETMKEGD